MDELIPEDDDLKELHSLAEARNAEVCGWFKITSGGGMWAPLSTNGWTLEQLIERIRKLEAALATEREALNLC